MTDNTDIGTTDIEEEVKTPILKPKKKREMTEKQKASLEAGRQRRKAKLDEKKESIKMEYAKKLYESSLGVSDPQTSKEELSKQKSGAVEKDSTQKTKDVKQQSKALPLEEESVSSDEETVVIKSKPKSKPQKKKKKIVIELSSSDESDTEEEYGRRPHSTIEEPEETTQPTRKMITQQNKKSVIKVHNEPSKKNYFVD